MLNVKKILINLLSHSAIDLTERKVTWGVTVVANNSNNTSLKTLIDADLPSGYKFIGISGFTTNDIYITPISVRYHDSAYSLQVSNRYTTSRTTTVEVYYLCAKLGGGYFLKALFHRLSARRWEYAERKETLHETFAGGNLHISHGFKIRDNGWKCNEPGKRIYSAVKRTLADCFRRNSDNNRKRFCERTQQINRGWFRSLCTDSCGKRIPRLLICGGNERKREIGYVPKHRLNTDYSVRTELYQAEITISERGWSCA